MSFNQLIMLVVAGIIVCGGAVLHGKKTDRWLPQRSERLINYTQRLKAVPTKIGAWTSEPLEVNQEQFRESNCDGVYSHVFTNPATNDTVSVFLVSGRGYHCTIHTPDECYVAAGFEMGKDPVSHEFELAGSGEKHEFVHTVFNKETPTVTERLRIFWLYSEDGKTWRSPKGSRAKIKYGEVDAMYKLYLIRNVAKGGVPKKMRDDAGFKFAKQFLPAVAQALAAPAAPAAVPPQAAPQG